LRSDVLDELLELVGEHLVLRELPVLLSDGSFVRAIKRERFLSDIIRRMRIPVPAPEFERPLELKPGEVLRGRVRVDNVQPSGRAVRYSCTDLVTGRLVVLDSGETRENLRASNLRKEMRSHEERCRQAGIPRWVREVDIGERRPGDFLVESYEVLEVRYGGFGIVYVVLDHRSWDLAAIKTYNDEIRWRSPTGVRRFWHEANQWVTLPRHPNVVTAERVRDVDGRLHLFLEYVEGGDLGSRLARGPATLAEALAIAVQICGALEHIHARGLVHRDIKPANILLTAEGTAKVTDLGLAVVFSDDSRCMERAGTGGYMAPEQISSPNNVSPKTDVYALGVVLLQMLTNTYPEIVPRAPRELNPQVTSSVSRLVLACLDPDPDGRPDATQLWEALAAEYDAMNGKKPPRSSAPDADGLLGVNILSSLAALGRTGDALQLCDNVLRKNPHSRTARYTRALLLYDLHNHQDCAALCLELLNESDQDGDPDNSAVGTLLDMCGAWLGFPQGDADEWEARAHLAAMGGGDSILALKLIEVALRRDDNLDSVWFLKGNCLHNLGRYEEAIVCYERVARSSDVELSGFAVTCAKRSRSILDGTALPQFRSEKLVARGRACVVKGDFPAGANFFQRALQEHQENVEALIGLGAVLDELGRPVEALDYYDRALALAPSDPSPWYHKGRTLQILNRFQEALQCNDRALELSAEDEKAWNNKGACLFYLGRIWEARACFNRALRLRPGNRVAKQGFAQCTVYTLKRICKKLWPWSRPYSPDPSLSEYWISRGADLSERGHLREGLACYRTALEFDPMSAIAWYNAGYALWMLDQHRAALEHCERALILNPRLADAWNIHGNALDDLGRRDEAIDSFNRAIELNSKHYEAWNGKGVTLQAQGRHEEALRCYDRACCINSRFIMGLTNKGNLLSAVDRHQEALVCYEAILAIDPHHPRAFQWRATNLSHLGRYEEAIQSYRRAIDIDPDNAGAWCNLGGTQAMLGSIGDAMTSLRRALQIDPHLGEARRNLERLKTISSNLSP
jgi:tetratricopeptide (TPR) repeat protein